MRKKKENKLDWILPRDNDLVQFFNMMYVFAGFLDIFFNISPSNKKSFVGNPYPRSNPKAEQKTKTNQIRMRMKMTHPVMNRCRVRLGRSGIVNEIFWPNCSFKNWG